VLVGGCGGRTRQDAHEPKGTFDVRVTHASFPAKQAMATPSRFELRVANGGPHTVPNLAVTVDSFSYTSNYPGLAANKRPVWVVEEGPGTPAKSPVESQAISPPGGGQTAYVNTWALGPLARNQTQTFVWKVTPVKAGMYTVHFKVAAGLSGRAIAQLSSGRPAQGQFKVDIAPVPPVKHVDPNTGRIVSGALPTVP
jgi:hypothetical protein